MIELWDWKALKKISVQPLYLTNTDGSPERLGHMTEAIARQGQGGMRPQWGLLSEHRLIPGKAGRPETGQRLEGSGLEMEQAL